MSTENRQPPPSGSGMAPLPVLLGPQVPPLPATSRWALFLDLDGTVLDLQPRPDAVTAEGGLTATLRALERQTGGALALVTGRTVAFVDHLFAGHRFTVAGLHGAELRPAPTLAAAFPAPPPDRGDASAFGAARDRARTRAAALPGVLFEDKGRAFALHYRQAPGQRTAVERLMREALAQAGPGHLLRAGKALCELGPQGWDKGAALRALMAAPPFLGRWPLAVGDDLTDEAMFGAANALGGLSLRVGAEQELAGSAAVAGIATPAALRAWLREAAA